MMCSWRKYLTHIGQTTNYTDAKDKIPTICVWMKE